MEISANTVIRQNPDILTSEIDGETVMMDSNFEHYFGMADIGTRIWLLAKDGISVASLCDVLTNEYDVSSDQCLIDVSPFLSELLTKGMLMIEQREP